MLKVYAPGETRGSELAEWAGRNLRRERCKLRVRAVERG